MSRIILLLIFSLVQAFGGAAFESESYLIWIGSKCPTGSTTCTHVTYNQTDKHNGKTLIIQGGEPIVGNLSGNLIGYKFLDLKSKQAFELSMNLEKQYTLYIRSLSGDSQIGKAFKQEIIKPINENTYLQKIKKIKK
ncbi:hypothetical protein CQA66_00175 [Helicobacter aurati]|uniref:Uncharacterized protein n=1 Tax=Helicobacter aurati TaxID=137778 RepID=A0A3D8J893_9HELI|nr:hypothetical protein [Helicobacter aurati]RDU73648.1 hypothetical protein CQA66_00175 [Helicobacter aurati]